MYNGKNIIETKRGQTVIIGRMKGNINLGDKIYKMSSKKLNLSARESLKQENRKIPLNCSIDIKKGISVGESKGFLYHIFFPT